MHPPKITSPRFARSTVSGPGRPITSGTSRGGPPFGIGKTSIGEKLNASQTAHAVNDGRSSVNPNLRKNTQARISSGRLTNRRATNQKQLETRRTASQTIHRNGRRGRLFTSQERTQP